MLPDRVSRKVSALSDASARGRKVRDLMRIMGNPEIWLEAYAQIAGNDGAVTPGVSDNTLDGFGLERVHTLIKSIKEGTYRPTPVRRAYIPKANGDKRPLGIPSGDDKLVQTVMKNLLEAVFEPIFSEDSHGFRPERSCHTALESILKTWAGMKWVISVDIKSFYDNINHKKMMEIVGKRIDDKRFMKLLKLFLEAGYVEDWTFHRTYSGTPQGGTISPILSNIYLNELDTYIEGLRVRFDKGKGRQENPAYKSLTTRISRLEKKSRILGASAPDVLSDEVKKLRTERDKLRADDPVDKGYRRLRYCRYADDFAIGIIGSKEEAISIEADVHQFIRNELRLQVSEAKSKLQHLSNGHLFLGHELKVTSGNRRVKTWRYGRPRKDVASEGQLNLLDFGTPKPKKIRTGVKSYVDRVELGVPPAKLEAFCKRKGYGDYWGAKPRSRPGLLARSEIEIVSTYNAELRGLANFYALCPRVKVELRKLNYLSLYSLMKTLAHKHKETKAKWFKRMKRDTDYVLTYQVGDQPKEVKVFQLKHLNVKTVNWESVDRLPNTAHYRLGRTELLRRLNAEKCEYCGDTEHIEIHHVRKVKDLKGKELWEQVMIAMKRKQIVLCRKCHRQLHSGRLPSVVEIKK